MNATKNCPACGSELPADAPLGLCPACLIQQAAGAQPAATRAANEFQPPTPQSLSAQFPHLEVLELLGVGGMGAVYKARQTMLDRFVALKILLPGLSEDPTFAERFVREAGAMAKLTHPNLVTVYDFGETDGKYWLLMEYVDGHSLRDAIRSGRLSPQEAVAVIPQICEALQYAHDERVVHRDIKPENILLDSRGNVRIADFGLAKLVGRSPIEVTLTATHQVMGTLHYMAPEQMERPLDVDHRADIYSLGVVFYELLTGDLPLGRYKLPSEKRQLDARLDDVVTRSLEREPDERYQHASDVKMDIETIQKVPPAIAPPAIAPTIAPTIAPQSSPANRARTISVPISLAKPASLESDTLFGQGVARFDGERVTLEVDINPEDASSGAKPGLHEVSIPIDELSSIRLETGWIVNSLFLQAHSVKSVVDVPGADGARVTMIIDKRDLREAKEFSRVVGSRLRELSPETQSPDVATANAVTAAGTPEDWDDAEEMDDEACDFYIVHPGKIAMGLAWMVCAGVMAAVALTNHRHDELIWVSFGILMGGGIVTASGTRTGLENGWQLYGINWGPVAMGLVMLALGGSLFSIGVTWAGRQFLWVGLGIALGGACCLAGGWELSKREVHFRLSATAATSFVMGLILELIGIGLMVAGFHELDSKNADAFIWIGFGLVLGGGGCWAVAWEKVPGLRGQSAQEPRTAENADSQKPESDAEADRRHARERLRVPAIAILICGCLNGLLLMVAILAMLWSAGGENTWLPGAPEIAIIACPSILGLGMLIGATGMLTLRRHSTAMLGATLAVVPCTPLWVFSVAFGIWGLMALNNDDIKRQFDRVV